MRRTNPMWRTMLIALTAGLLSAVGVGCGLQDSDRDWMTESEREQTREYRRALVSAEDIEMEYGATDDTATSALGEDGETDADELSGLALLTADIVVNTSRGLVRHAWAVKAVMWTRPEKVGDDRAVWKHEHEDLSYRLTVERDEADRGTRYRFRLHARRAENSSAEMKKIYGGWVVRIDSDDGTKPGFGVVRYHLDAFDTLKPKEDYSGMARVAFRRAGGVHQVVVRARGVKTPKEPGFPPVASYRYTLLPDDSGTLRWFSRSDFNRDGDEPLEKVAFHSRWRSDRSGVSTGTARGGTMEHASVRATECWDGELYETYGFLGWDDGRAEKGARSTCLEDPSSMDAPTFEPNLPDSDPPVPDAHPAETN